jgi:protein involved in polysaccharide export with SLBB domain
MFSKKITYCLAIAFLSEAATAEGMLTPAIAAMANANSTVTSTNGDLSLIKNLGPVNANSAKPATDSRAGIKAITGPLLDKKPTEETTVTPISALSESTFQRFVREASGKTLPLFGVSLFDQASSSYAPMQNIPVTSDYSVGPGDELLIRVWGALDAEVRAVVDRSGQISIPKVGTFSVLGIKAAELDRYIQGKIGRVFRNFEVNVSLGHLRSMQVYVVGHARRPGTYTLSSLSSLVNALFASGGPSETGSMRHIQLKRKGSVITELDLYEFINKGDNSNDVRLQPGDVIVIPPVGPQVAVLGTVRTPGIYELKAAETSIADVLAWGGGMPIIATTRMASLERIQPNASTARSVTTITLDATGQATRLRDGDMLSIYEISPKFENAVTLRGNVAAPLRHRFSPGMRIRDLIPEQNALIVSDYYRRNNALVLTSTEGQTEIIHRVRNSTNEVHWDYAVIERLNPDNLTTSMLPFNLGKAVLEADPAHNLELKAGDVVTIFSKNDIALPQVKKTRLVNVEGEVNAAGVYQLQPGETLRQLLQRAGGITSQAYVFGTEFTREKTRKEQQERLDQAISRLEQQATSMASSQLANLTGQEAADRAQIMYLQQQQQQQQQQVSRLKSLKSNGRIALELATQSSRIMDLPDLPLEDGDRIHIPARNAYVMAVGAVNNDNAMIWKSGRTVENVLRLAAPLESADMENTFLLRADGTVISKNKNGAWLFSLSSGFDDIELMPGDAVVVPEKLDKKTAWTNFMTGLKDWTQILYQMGLGAAAWKTIR